MASKNDFSFLRKAPSLPSEAQSPVGPQPTLVPINADTSVRADVDSPSTLSTSKLPRAQREKYTTAIKPDIRDDMEIELAKLRREGKRQSAADLIETLLLKWLAERRSHV